MARLYYEQPKIPAATKAITETKKTSGDWLNKVATLIPGEVIAGYLAMIGFVGSIESTKSQNIFIWVIFLSGLILTPLYLNKVADADKPKRNHLILSTIAFVVWAYVTTGAQLLHGIAPGLFDQAVASIILVLFSLISGLIPLNK